MTHPLNTIDARGGACVVVRSRLGNDPYRVFHIDKETAQCVFMSPWEKPWRAEAFEWGHSRRSYKDSTGIVARFASLAEAVDAAARGSAAWAASQAAVDDAASALAAARAAQIQAAKQAIEGQS